MVEPFFRRTLSGGRIEGQPQLGTGSERDGYNPDQPRVPAGHPDGGQWTDTGAGSAELRGPPEKARSLDEIIKNAIEDAALRQVYAAARPRGGRPVNIQPATYSADT